MIILTSPIYLHLNLQLYSHNLSYLRLSQPVGSRRFSRLLFAPRRLSLNIHDFYISFNVSALNSISDHYFENEAMIAWWNDRKARDQRARIEKTFNHGRFSREKSTLGISSWSFFLFRYSVHSPCGPIIRNTVYDLVYVPIVVPLTNLGYS